MWHVRREPTTLDLSQKEQAEFDSWARRRKNRSKSGFAGQDLAGGGRQSEQYRHLVRTHHRQAYSWQWRERLGRQRVDGLLGEPRFGAPRRGGDEQVAELIDRTLCERLPGATH